MEVYGVVYGSLTVVHMILMTQMPTLANVLGPVKALLQMALKQLVFSQELGRKAGNHEWKLKMTGRDSKGNTIVKALLL